MKNLFKTAILAAAAVFAIAPTSSFAATTGDVEAKVGIKAGELSIEAADETVVFPEIQMNGSMVESKADLLNIRMIDARGTADGYQVTVASSRMTEVGGVGLQLDPGSMKMKNFNEIMSFSNAPAPAINDWAEGSFIDDGSSHIMAVANQNEGMGTFVGAFPLEALSLFVSPGTKVTDEANYPNQATPFASTITFSIVTGP